MNDQKENQKNRDARSAGAAAGIVTDPVLDVVCQKCGCEIDVSDLESFVRVECPDCGHIEIVPAKLGQFLLLDLIGAGGMGGVYYAKDETLGRYVAIKIMLQSLGSDKQFVENFKKEAQAAARLNHPNIVQIYSFGQEKGQPYIVMELVSGKALEKFIDPDAPLDPSVVLQVGLDIAHALSAADEAGLVHGDVKPENILFDDKGRAKLVDFGIASFAKQKGTHAGIWGTPYYIAPEKVRRETVDARADIYSLGATLYHALTGRPPFEGETPIEVVKARLQGMPAPVIEVCPSISAAVDRIVMRMLQPDPFMRYPNYASLIGDLQKGIRAVGPTRKTAMMKTGLFSKAKRTSANVAAEGLEGVGGAGQWMGTPRIRVHKKSGISAGGGSPLAEYRARTTGIGGDPVPAGKSRKTRYRWRRRRKKMSRAKKTLLLLLAVLAGGGALARHVMHRQEQRFAERRLQLQVEAYRGQAADAVARIDAAAGDAQQWSARERARRADITNAVEVVLGEWPLPDRAEADGRADMAAEAEPADDPVPSRLAGTGPPAGMPTREELERRRQPQPAAMEDFEVDPAPAGLDLEEDADLADPPDPPPAIMVAAQEHWAAQRKLDQYVAEMSDLKSRAPLLKEQVLRAPSFALLQAGVGQIERMAQAAQRKRSAAETQAQQAQEAFGSVRRMRVAYEEDIEAQELAAREAEQRRREAQERGEHEERRQMLAEQEMNQVEMAQAEARIKLPEHHFDQIKQELEAEFRDFETEQGRAAADLLMTRYRRMGALLDFFIVQLNEKPFSWGWIRPRQDVLGASRKGVRLRSGVVPWSEVNAAQMLRFAERYTTHPDVRVSEQGEHSLNAAIYFVERGEGAERALKQALPLYRRAIRALPRLQADARRLIPDVVALDEF